MARASRTQLQSSVELCTPGRQGSRAQLRTRDKAYTYNKFFLLKAKRNFQRRKSSQTDFFNLEGKVVYQALS